MLFLLASGLTACGSGLSSTQCNAALNSWNHLVETYSAYRKNIGYLKNTVIGSTAPPERPHDAALGMLLYPVDVSVTTGDALMAKPYFGSTVLSVFPDVQRGLQDIGTDAAAFADKLDDHKILESPSNQWARTSDGSEYIIGFDTPVKTSSIAWQRAFGSTADRMAADYQKTLATMKEQYAQKCGGDASEVRSADDF